MDIEGIPGNFKDLSPPDEVMGILPSPDDGRLSNEIQKLDSVLRSWQEERRDMILCLLILSRQPATTTDQLLDEFTHGRGTRRARHGFGRGSNTNASNYGFRSLPRLQFSHGNFDNYTIGGNFDSHDEDVRIEILDDGRDHERDGGSIDSMVARNKFLDDCTNVIIGITGQAAVTLVTTSSTNSPFLHFFTAATGVGFLGSFLANFVMKKPKLARIMSKIGAIGASSAVILALGMYLPKDTKWNVDTVATAAACLATGMVVATA